MRKVRAVGFPGAYDLDAIVDPNDSRHVSQDGLQDLFQVKRGKNACHDEGPLAKADGNSVSVSAKMSVTTQPLQGLVNDVLFPTTALERSVGSLVFPKR